MAIQLLRPTDTRVLLMGTCLCDVFYDDTAKATVEVLEHLGVTVEYPKTRPAAASLRSTPAIGPPHAESHATPPPFSPGNYPSSSRPAHAPL